MKMYYYINPSTIYCDECKRVIEAQPKENDEDFFIFVHDDVVHESLEEVTCQ